jgi:hypothetical protein
MWKKAIMASFKVLPGGTEGNHQEPQSEYLVPTEIQTAHFPNRYCNGKSGLELITFVKYLPE